MKEYLMKFDENGKPTFVDEQDRASYRKLLSFMKNGGVTKFIMRIEEHKGSLTTENQVNLWNFLVGFIETESGNDRKTINDTLNDTGREVKDLSHKEFQDLLQKSFAICNEFFGVEIYLNENGNIEKKNQWEEPH